MCYKFFIFQTLSRNYHLYIAHQYKYRKGFDKYDT